MKIGFVLSSLTQSIPYMTYLVSLGYEVFPIILKKEACTDFNKTIVAVIESIANTNILYNTDLEKDIQLDCLVIMESLEEFSFLKTLDYNNLLKQNAPIILNIGKEIEEQPFLLLSYPNLHVINYNSGDVVENCNQINNQLEKTLNKK